MGCFFHIVNCCLCCSWLCARSKEHSSSPSLWKFWNRKESELRQDFQALGSGQQAKGPCAGPLSLDLTAAARGPPGGPTSGSHWLFCFHTWSMHAAHKHRGTLQSLQGTARSSGLEEPWQTLGKLMLKEHKYKKARQCLTLKNIFMRQENQISQDRSLLSLIRENIVNSLALGAFCKEHLSFLT